MFIFGTYIDVLYNCFLSNTGLYQQSNGHSTSHIRYENNSVMDKDIPTTKFQPSAAYSLMSPENETSPGMSQRRVTNGEEVYCMLDRNCEKSKTTARQREQLNGYSRLFSN